MTFNKDVAPIIFAHCTTCHRPGEVAPFPLLTYQDAKSRAPLMAKVVASRLMPPWKPVPGYGEFLGNRRLTDAQIRVIGQWVREGAPEGDPHDLPQAPRFVSGWQLGQPDLVLKMARPFNVPATGDDVYHCFVLRTGLTEDKYVVGFEERPSNRRVVHHSIIVQDEHGAARRLAHGSDVGYPCFGGFGFPAPGYLGFWTPGAVPHRQPPGIAEILKKRADLVLQTHFHPDGRPEEEQTTIGLYFAQRPPREVPMDLTVGSVDIDIPAGDAHYKVASFAYVPGDVEVISIIPHCHLLCREVMANATLPDGGTKPLIWIKDWEFNWQQQYWYRTPVKLPAGTRVDMEMIYDNSSRNPRNPHHPPERVTWGEQSTDEMAEVHLEVVPEQRRGH